MNNLTKTVTRYTQPVIQVQPGREFRTAEVPLFEDPKGQWVRYDDIKHLLPPDEPHAVTKQRDIVAEARSLCDQIAGQLDEGERGSIEIATVLVDEIERLNAYIKKWAEDAADTDRKFQALEQENARLRAIENAALRVAGTFLKRNSSVDPVAMHKLDFALENQGRAVEPSADYRAVVVPSVCGKPMPDGKGAGQCINVPGHEGECDDMPF